VSQADVWLAEQNTRSGKTAAQSRTEATYSTRCELTAKMLCNHGCRTLDRSSAAAINCAQLANTTNDIDCRATGVSVGGDRGCTAHQAEWAEPTRNWAQAWNARRKASRSGRINPAVMISGLPTWPRSPIRALR
jgi:hypothetical protein